MRPYFAYCTNHKIIYDRFFVFIIANKNAFYFLIIFLSQYVNELSYALGLKQYALGFLSLRPTAYSL